MEQGELSLAGRVVVANSVLLSSIWYIASTWLFSRSIMLKVQRLIRNFIWGNTTGDNSVAKVASSVLIQSKKKGGLGLIDPFMQSKALITKHVVRSLLPGDELWKKLWIQHLHKVKPSVGGQWHDSLRWFLMQIFNYLSPMLDHYVSLVESFGHGKLCGKHLFSCHRKIIINSCANL